MHVPCKVLCKFPLKLCRLHKLPRYDCPEGAVGLLRLGPASWALPGWLNHPLPLPGRRGPGTTPLSPRDTAHMPAACNRAVLRCVNCQARPLRAPLGL